MLKNMKLVSRLHFSLALLFGFGILFGLVGFTQTSKMSATMDDIYRKGLTGGQLLTETSAAGWKLHLGVANYAQAGVELAVALGPVSIALRPWPDLRSVSRRMRCRRVSVRCATIA